MKLSRALTMVAIFAAGCADQCTDLYGGTTLGTIDLQTSTSQGSATFELPPDQEIAFYENHGTRATGTGDAWHVEQCFRLDLTIEQAGHTRELECVPLGGRRDTMCLNSYRGATDSGTMCATVNCEDVTLADGGATTVTAKRTALQPCGWKPIRHTLVIKKPYF